MVAGLSFKTLQVAHIRFSITPLRVAVKYINKTTAITKPTHDLPSYPSPGEGDRDRAMAVIRCSPLYYLPVIPQDFVNIM